MAGAGPCAAGKREGDTLKLRETGPAVVALAPVG